MRESQLSMMMMMIVGKVKESDLRLSRYEAGIHLIAPVQHGRGCLYLQRGAWVCKIRRVLRHTTESHGMPLSAIH